MKDPEPGLILLSNLPPLTSVFTGFTIEAVFILLAIIVLLIISGMISGSEIAFFSLSPNQREEILESDSKALQIGVQMLLSSKKLLAGILISNNFVNISIILLSTILTQMIFDFSENQLVGYIIQIGVITILLLLFGEIMPKILAKQKAIFFIQIMSKPLQMVLIVFKPLISLLSKTTNIIDKRLSKHKPQLSMKDLSDAIELTGNLDDSAMAEEDQKILKGIATFGDTDVKEIMKARVDVKAIDIGADIKGVISYIQEWGYSRIPVFEENIDQIKGILYIKDLLSFLDVDEMDWLAKLRPAFFVPENKKINDLLQEFRAKKIHLAIVVDEYGGTSGIVTLEDVLEEIVGDINDEFDDKNEEFLFTKVEDNLWIFEAKISIIDFCKTIDISDDIFEEVKGESDSIAGLILELKGDFPKLNEIIVFDNIEFEILKMDKRRISRIRVRKI